MIDIIVIILLSLSSTGIIFCVFMLRRNEQIFRFQMEMLDQVSTATRNDIRKGLSWEWRYEAMSAVDSSDMMRQFWRPLDDFYPDKKFLTIGSRP